MEALTSEEDKTLKREASELYHVVNSSGASKTGAIPVTYNQEQSTCPDSCPLRESGCYAKTGNVAMWWRRLNAATKETKSYLTFDRLISWVRSLPKRQAWRYGVAGDLPHTGDGQTIDADKLQQLVEANAVGRKKGFAYTHHDPRIEKNAEAIAHANKGGFTINLSADGLSEADQLADMGIAPVVTIMPKTDKGVTRTPNGRKVLECLATNSRSSAKNCVECGFICAMADRKFIVGFVPHGHQKKSAERIMLQN